MEVTIMKRLMLTFLIACIAISGAATLALGEEMPAEALMAAQRVDEVTPREDALLRSVDSSNLRFTRLENTMLGIVSFFHQRKIGQAIVEKEFVRYQFDTKTGRLIEQTRKWREGLPDRVTPAIPREQAESLVEGVVTSSQLFIISPESEIFHIEPTPKNPCWVVRSMSGERRIITVIDAMTGEKLGYGVPPPYQGLSIHGPDHDDPPAHICDNNNPLWYNHAKNAHDWFEIMGYDTIQIGAATGAQVQEHIQSDTTVMFYELDHGGSTSFKNRCEDDILATEIEAWIAGYASMGFSFIGSCMGMCDTADNTFTFEFRKGSNFDSVVVGYCGMSDDALCGLDCWPNAIAWQTVLFDHMNNGYTVGVGYAQANLKYPECANDGHNCMRIAGDANLVFGGVTYPNPRRSFCGAIYNTPPLYISPLYSMANTAHTRAHHIRCNSYVPSGSYLTIGASAGYPFNEVAFANSSKLTAFGSLYAETGSGNEISFASASDRGKGIKLYSGQFNLYNGGEMKVHE
jgi:hypothetical protein